jgi:two-component system cell cycle sensor histidine kinase PleC
MPMLGRHRAARPSSLLARYCDSFGEMQLRKYTERAIRAARSEAELNHRAKTAFLSTMSHELRTPLNAIIGFSDLMCMPGTMTQDQAVDYASHISNAGRRLLNVISDVMDMSKLEAGSLVLEREPLLIDEVLELALEKSRDLFAAKLQPIDMRIDKNLPEVEGDAKRLIQLFAHLLSNASKFTPEKGRILVMARALKDGAVTVAIADTGRGMSHEQMVMAMKPFAQVEGYLSRSQEGVGLGLPLAQGITKLHGGTLNLDSQPGAGTTAMVTLPGRAVQSSAIGKVA